MRHKFAGRIDMRFKYTPAAKTNIAKTFARIRKQLASEEAERRSKVSPLKNKARGA